MVALSTLVGAPLPMHPPLDPPKSPARLVQLHHSRNMYVLCSTSRMRPCLAPPLKRRRPPSPHATSARSPRAAHHAHASPCHSSRRAPRCATGASPPDLTVSSVVHPTTNHYSLLAVPPTSTAPSSSSSSTTAPPKSTYGSVVTPALPSSTLIPRRHRAPKLSSLARHNHKHPPSASLPSAMTSPSSPSARSYTRRNPSSSSNADTTIATQIGWIRPDPMSGDPTESCLPCGMTGPSWHGASPVPTSLQTLQSFGDDELGRLSRQRIPSATYKSSPVPPWKTPLSSSDTLCREVTYHRIRKRLMHSERPYPEDSDIGGRIHQKESKKDRKNIGKPSRKT